MARPDEEVNRVHCEKPEPGDYWHEMFSPVALVLAVSAYHVAFLKHTNNDKDGWTWDTSKVDAMTPAEFAKFLKYGGSGPLSQKTCGDVVPNWKHWKEFANEASAHAAVGGAAPLPGEPG